MEIKYPVYFVIGTRAQFIKVAPVMRAMKDRGLSYTLIYTAQHRENINEILDVYELRSPDVVLYDQKEANTRLAFLRWFLVIFAKILFRAKEYISTPGLLLTHGDTFTAWLGALMGKRTGCLVGHIESGYRSYNIFSPFPEEISRLITFWLADFYFCADEWTVENLRGYKGRKINLGANTMLDGVRYALQRPLSRHFAFQESRYGVVSIHRFENIFTPRFTRLILPLLKKIAQKYRLVFTLHPATRERLVALGLYDELSRSENILLHERFGFVDWINVCSQADFVITDGGSNQQELSYLGVPTLLFRNETESREGVGRNIVLSKFDDRVISEFIENPRRFKNAPPHFDVYPSERIVHVLCSIQSLENKVVRNLSV